MTDSTKVRRVQEAHYVSVDPSIWDCLVAEPKNSPKLFKMLSVAGKMSCSNCRKDCGVVVKYRNVYLPALKIENFVIVSHENREKKIPVKKWKQATDQYFIVDPLEHKELLPMYHALKPDTQAKLDEALASAETAAAVTEAASRR